MIADYIRRNRTELEMQSRLRSQTAYLGPELILCRVLGRYLMYADPRDLDITPHLCLDGFWESWITLAMARALHSRMFCVDIGANHGYYTLLMADAVGEDGHVLAIEPNSALAELTRLSACANGFGDRVEVVEAAANHTSAESVQLVIPPRHTGHASICRQPAATDRVKTVPTLSVDDATADWPRVDLIKIDAEGAEPAIWEGMRRTLAKNPQLTLFLELTPSAYPRPNEFLLCIEDAGYPLRYIDAEGTSRLITPEDVLASRDESKWWMLYLSKC